jgi:hypothetical protein
MFENRLLHHDLESVEKLKLSEMVRWRAGLEVVFLEDDGIGIGDD